MEDQVVATFGTINDDCKVNILSFLPTEDLNSFAMCNRNCRKVRANESLDQTRTATILWTANTTMESFLSTVRDNRLVFTGNRRTLFVRVLGVNAAFGFCDPPRLPPTTTQLDQITNLECSFDGHPYIMRDRGHIALHIISNVLPNLRRMTVSSTTSNDTPAFFNETWKSWPFLKKITWSYCKYILPCGTNFAECSSLTHLYIDGSTFYGEWDDLEPSDEPEDHFLMKCSRLEYLSIKGANQIPDVIIDDLVEEPLAQDRIIDMVRHHPTLRWLRSDLTADNIAMLKQERPEITFVSD